MKNTITASYHSKLGKTVALFAAFAVSALVFAGLAIRVKAYGINGISVSDDSLSRGDRFTVSVTVPAARTNADSASLRIEFDNDVFEPVVKQGWASDLITNASSGSGDGFIALSAGNASRAIDLSSDTVISAGFTVKNTAPAGQYAFTITKASFSYAEDDGITIHELWEPETIAAYVTVDDSEGSGQDDEPEMPDEPGDEASYGGGIRLSKNTVEPGELFNAYIEVPAAYVSADTLSVRAEFDSDAFEIVSWEPGLPASEAVNSGSGFFAVSASSADKNITLENGLTLTAQMRARNDAAGMTGSFTLVSHSISKVEDDGYTNTELWAPQTLRASAKITGETPYIEPIKGGGISASVESVKQGATFSVYVTVPAIQEYADTASILAEFDSDMFEVVSWAPSMPGSFKNSGSGFFSLAASNADKVIDLTRGLTLKAELRAKSNSPVTTGIITLKRASLAYVESNGYDYRELWQPAVTSVRVSVSRAETPVTRPSYIPNYNIPSNTSQTTERTAASTTTTTARTVTPVTVADSDDDTTGLPEDFDDEEDPFIDPEPPTDDDYEPEFPDDEEDENEPDFPDEEESGGNRSKKINVALEQDLSGLGGEKIRIKTRYEFFDHDIIIIISDLPDNEPDAVSALKLLGMSGHDIYPFDVSVFDTVTNTYIKRLPDGAYIEITIPLPDNMRAYADSIELYHIVNGDPEKVPSSIVTEDGVKKITFSLNSFSPFMMVNTVYTSAPEIVMPASIPDSSGAINPATGVAAAVGVPVVLTGCVLLARKTKKRRKRATNHQEEEKETSAIDN
ncbi:MAG: hypothetical protein II820_07965 [Ruminiclostridium sp.]|nr:hypothetical protein [Ruminiclostridium sp.]